eukprot:PITA_09285
MKHKDEAFNVFKELKEAIENQTGKNIKVFRSDNGEEYTSNEFIEFCKQDGTKKENIVPYNPKQNGVVERKNWFIMEVSQAMLKDQNLLNFLWGEATNTTVYVQNRVLDQALDKKTLEEVFESVKPNIGHLRIFGCTAYFHVLKGMRNKMEAVGKKDVALGKAIGIPLPLPKKKSDDMDILEGPSMPNLEKEVDDNPVKPMDPFYPPPSYPPTRKRPLWL